MSDFETPDAAGAAGSMAPELVTRMQIESYRASVPDYAQRLIDSSLDMIISVDLLLRIVEFNPAAERAFGYAREEVIGQNVEMLYADPQEAWRVRMASFGRGYSGEVRNRRKSGEEFICYLSSVSLCDDSGEVLGAMGFSRDISLEKRRAAELMHARQEADSAARARSRLLSHVSQELGAAVSAMLEQIETLSDPTASLSEDARETAQKAVRRNGGYLTELAANLAELGRFDRGDDAAVCDCEPRRIVNEVAELIRARATADTPPLIVQACGALPERIRTDPVRLKQALINLVSQAAQLAPDGELWLSVRAEAYPTRGEGRLHFEIRNTGMTLTQQQLNGLIDADASAIGSRSGVGLSIAQEIARLLEGSVSASGDPAMGGTLRLTISSDETAATAKASAATMRSTRAPATAAGV